MIWWNVEIVDTVYRQLIYLLKKMLKSNKGGSHIKHTDFPMPSGKLETLYFHRIVSNDSTMR